MLGNINRRIGTQEKESTLKDKLRNELNSHFFTLTHKNWTKFFGNLKLLKILQESLMSITVAQAFSKTPLNNRSIVEWKLFQFFTEDYVKKRNPQMLNSKPRTIINIQRFEIACFSGFLIWVMSELYVYH